MKPKSNQKTQSKWKNTVQNKLFSRLRKSHRKLKHKGIRNHQRNRKGDGARKKKMPFMDGELKAKTGI